MHDNNIAIRVENLGKQYRIGELQASYRTIREAIVDAVKSPFVRASSLLRGQAYGAANLREEIWALRNVSFEVKEGEVLGIIGKNGAGKTTLLKILSRIAEPTEGKAEIHGRVRSLLEVGTGMHQELTGRENIFLNGAILGMRREEIKRKFEEIVEFSGIERFMDTPMKHYSSGMQVRLAFSIAAHLEPQILLIDEVLAVGDAAFQERCMNKMKDISTGGRTVLFISHNMAAISNLCSSAFLLQNGHLEFSGSAKETIDQYLHIAHSSMPGLLRDRTDRKGEGKVTFTNISIMNKTRRPVNSIACGEEVRIKLDYESSMETSLSNASFSIAIYDVFGQHLILAENEMSGFRMAKIPSKGSVICSIPRVPITPGNYDLNISCYINGVNQDWVPRAGHLIVSEGDFYATGKLPSPAHAGFLVEQVWETES